MIIHSTAVSYWNKIHVKTWSRSKSPLIETSSTNSPLLHHTRSISNKWNVPFFSIDIYLFWIIRWNYKNKLKIIRCLSNLVSNSWKRKFCIFEGVKFADLNRQITHIISLFRRFSISIYFASWIFNFLFVFKKSSLFCLKTIDSVVFFHLGRYIIVRNSSKKINEKLVCL